MADIHFTKPEDIAAHYGEDYTLHYGAMSPPIFQTSIFNEDVGGPYSYSRVTNPTDEVFENKVAAMEHAMPGDGGRALVTSSGVSAIVTAVMSVMGAGDHMIMVRSAYGSGRAAIRWLSRYGVDVTFVRGTELSQFEAALRPNTKLIYLESPSSGIFELQDLRAVSELAKAHGIMTAIDNTYCSPIYQQPLDMGIDLVVHSATKYLGGHSDVIAGVVVGRGDAIREAETTRFNLGCIAPPMQAWLLQRGIRTLPVRMKAHFENGMTVAQYLESHPMVERVYYPALESHPQHELYLRQMSGCGGLLSFKPCGSYESRVEMVSRFRVFTRAQSWGGYESLVYPLGALAEPNEEINAAYDGGVIRLAVGLENIDTLLEDLEQALGALR